MKPNKIQPTHIKTVPEFSGVIAELAQLETEKRRLEAERDAATLRAAQPFEEQLAPVLEKIAGKLALAETFAEEKRDVLLPGRAKSANLPGARYGFRIGNPTVKLLAKVKESHAIASLKARGLERYIVTEESIAKAAILADCSADRRELTSDKNKTVPLSEVGLRITQAETFFVEPLSESAETLTPDKAQPIAVAS